MVAVTYTVSAASGQLAVESSADIASGSEVEKRVAQLVKIAVDAASEEFMHKYQNGIAIQKEGVARTAATVAKRLLEDRDPLDDAKW